MGRGGADESARITTVFTDRDGTLNAKAPEDEYVATPSDVHLLPGVGPAVRRLNDAGVRVVVVTNQRGIARGLMSTAEYDAVERRVEEVLRTMNAHLDATFVCPHEIGLCDCRKPAPGLLLKASEEIPGVDLEGSVMIGDAPSDVEAGHRAGVRTIRIAPTADPGADHTAPSFPAAIDWLFRTGKIRNTARPT